MNWIKNFLGGLFYGIVISLICFFIPARVVQLQAQHSSVSGTTETEVVPLLCTCDCQEQIDQLTEAVGHLTTLAVMQDDINKKMLDLITSQLQKNNPGFEIDPDLLLQVFNAIEEVESGGNMNAIGDGGRSIGSFQIGEMYWQDAVEFDKSLGGVYTDVAKDREYAMKVMLAYWSRYANEWTPEELARIHNGGPKGLYKEATISYWNKVKKAMND